MLLSLDISTSCVGWSLYGQDKELIAAGAIQTDKCKSDELFVKLDYVVNEILNIIDKHNVKVEYLAAEAALKMFAGGKTTANTMSKLISFNFGLCYTLTRRLGCKDVMLDVKSARKSLGIVVPKGAKDKKKYVIDKIKPMYPNLAWDLKKTGNYKDYCGDMADAIVIGEFALKKIKNP